MPLENKYFEKRDHISHKVNKVISNLSQGLKLKIEQALWADDISLKILEIKDHCKYCKMRFGNIEEGDDYIFVPLRWGVYRMPDYNQFMDQENIMPIGSTTHPEGWNHILKRQRLLLHLHQLSNGKEGV